MDDRDIADLAGLLSRAGKVLLFTGAGISTGSGIPDYRGPQGLWKKSRPVFFDEFLASEEKRIEYWRWKSEGWPGIRDAEPNAVHRAAVELETAGRLLAVVTQNVDGLHREAGTTPDRLVEMHGTDSRVSCLSCGAESEPDPHYEAFAHTGRPPRCECGGWLKPATISFGQNLRTDDLDRAFRAATECDLAVSLGSTLSVHPACGVPVAAAERGVPYAVVNRGETDHDRLSCVTLRIEGDVGVVFPGAGRAALSS
jgi:NAD-dependent deacetylase